MPVTSVPWWMWTPIRSAIRAYAHTTASWRITPPGGWYSAAMIGKSGWVERSSSGQSFAISSG